MDMAPTYVIACVCLSSCSIDKKIAHCCFYIDKIKNKKIKNASRIAVFGCTTGNILIIFGGRGLISRTTGPKPGLLVHIWCTHPPPPHPPPPPKKKNREQVTFWVKWVFWNHCKEHTFSFNLMLKSSSYSSYFLRYDHLCKTVSNFAGSGILRNQPFKFPTPTFPTPITPKCLKISQKLHGGDRKYIKVCKKQKS